MNLDKAIQELYAERDALVRAIGLLEELLRTGSKEQGKATGGKRRGRKSMDPSERRAVSARMKRYWEKRRQRTEKTS